MGGGQKEGGGDLRQPIFVVGSSFFPGCRRSFIPRTFSKYVLTPYYGASTMGERGAPKRLTDFIKMTTNVCATLGGLIRSHVILATALGSTQH